VATCQIETHFDTFGKPIIVRPTLRIRPRITSRFHSFSRSTWERVKSLPPDARKDEAVEALVERKTQLRRSSSRMRTSLEEAMCRGDAFSGESLVELTGNVILRPMLERLVFIGEGIAGYPVGGGQGLRDQAGTVEPVKKTETLRLAHPVDFLESKRWTDWQQDGFAGERIQPFQQVFRELYIPTSQEQADATFSRRYAGQQVNSSSRSTASTGGGSSCHSPIGSNPVIDLISLVCHDGLVRLRSGDREVRPVDSPRSRGRLRSLRCSGRPGPGPIPTASGSRP
jgi:hypothetical protein